MTETRSIAGKVVVITGASSGIGEATALRLAADGARVVLGARREDQLRRLTERITTAGGEAVFSVTDVRRRSDLQRLIGRAVEAFDRVDVLVNNAGVMPVSPMSDLRVDEWDEMIDVNIRGVLHGIAAVLPIFRQQGAGHIVTISSTAALQVAPAMAVYAGTKQAVAAISEGLRLECGDAVRVTVVTPGMTDTNFASTMTNAQVRGQLEERRRTRSLPAAAIADAILYAIARPAGVEVGQVVVRPV